MREFLQIWRKHSFWLKNELIKFWWSNEKGHCELTKGRWWPFLNTISQERFEGVSWNVFLKCVQNWLEWWSDDVLYIKGHRSASLWGHSFSAEKCIWPLFNANTREQKWRLWPYFLQLDWLSGTYSGLTLKQSIFDLFPSGEVTPGLSQTEFELRRHRLASLVEAQADRLGPSASSSNHVVIVLSHPTRYMTNDIPYPFHQNQVHVWFHVAFIHLRLKLFFCLCGFLNTTANNIYWTIT